MDKKTFMTANGDFNNYEFYPGDIAEALVSITGQNIETILELTDAIYYLLAICENSLNDEYHRTFYKTLATLTDAIQSKEIIDSRRF